MINDYEIVINYMIKMRWEKFAYMNYRTYANRIKHEIRDDNEYTIRTVFQTLVDLKYIEKIAKRGKYLYKFNNPMYPRFEKLIILNFD